MADNEIISRRAHEIWEREGRPDGEAERHWREAEASLMADDAKPVKRAVATKLEKPAKAGKTQKATKPEKSKADAKPAKKGSGEGAKGAAGKKRAGKSAKKAG